MIKHLILVVNCDINLGQSIALILHRAGYLPTIAQSACEAMRHIQSGDFRLVILDSNMDEIKMDLLPKILVGYPNLSILLMTDSPIPKMDQENQLLRAHYLEKPVGPERLLDYVEVILA